MQVVGLVLWVFTIHHKEKKMAITKTETEDKIEVVNGGHAIQIRNKIVIKEDDAVISSSFNRRVIHPCVKTGDTWADYDTSSESDTIKGICNTVWTDAVKTSYKTNYDAALENKK